MLPDSPLPPCRSTRNCYAEHRSYAAPPEALFAAAVDAVRSLSGLTIGRAKHIERDGLTLYADFRVLVFTDDFDLAARPHENGAVLYVRSASRLGQGDLGTNRRRVEAFFECLDEAVRD